MRSPPDFLLLITGAVGPVVTVTTAQAPAYGTAETHPALAAPRRDLEVASVCHAGQDPGVAPSLCPGGWECHGRLGGPDLGSLGGDEVWVQPVEVLSDAGSALPPTEPGHPQLPWGHTWPPTCPASEAPRSTVGPGSRLTPPRAARVSGAGRKRLSHGAAGQRWPTAGKPVWEGRASGSRHLWPLRSKNPPTPAQPAKTSWRRLRARRTF